MRLRSWRRYKEKIKVISRLRRYNSHGVIINANKNIVDNYNWLDQIGTNNHFMFKTYTTDKIDSRYKNKYGKKGKNKHWHSYGNYRVKDKRNFKRMLELDHGIKHFNITYGFAKNDTGE